MTRFARCLALAAAAAAAAASESDSGSGGGGGGGGSAAVRRRAQSDPASSGGAPLPDAADNRLPSTESSFDHMLDLSPADGDGDGDGKAHHLSFHWNDPHDGAFVGRLIHRVPPGSHDPGWLGFGVYDVPARGVPDSASNVMVGSQAIIGNVPARDVSKYVLAGKKLGSPGGVEKMDASYQTLVPTTTSIARHKGDDGHVSTILTFEKMLKEMDDAEIAIREDEHNVFLYAVGMPAPIVDGMVPPLGMHAVKGAFKLNFADVRDRAKGRGSDGDADVPKQDNGEASDADASGAAAADALNKCKSDDPDYLHMIRIAPQLKLNYDLDMWSGSDPPTLTVKLTYEGGHAWLGFGVSPDGSMIGSEAVIGRPDLALADEEKPLKYRLKGKGTSAVVPMEEARQTLRDAQIRFEGDSTTIMTFTKILDEEGELPIEPTGTVTFVYAVGSGNALSYHKEKGSFRLDLSKCVSPDLTHDDAEAAGATTAAPQRINKSSWIAHGVIATLAWAFLAPFAVTTAWFRTLVPSSWIYVHVFSNVATFFLTLMAFLIAVVTMSAESAPSHFSDVHHVIGLAMLLLVTFQVMNGFLRPPVEKKDPYAMDRESSALAQFLHLPTTARDLWKLAHRAGGALLLAGGFYQIARGLDLYAVGFYAGATGSSWRPYFYFYLIVFGVVLVGLRGWMWWEERRARRTVDMMNPDQRQMGSLAVASGVDPNSELVPVQFDVGIQ